MGAGRGVVSHLLPDNRTVSCWETDHHCPNLFPHHAQYFAIEIFIVLILLR